MTQVLLYTCGIMFRDDKIGEKGIGTSATEGGVVLVIGFFLICQLYFSKDKYSPTWTTWILLGGTFVVCLALGHRFLVTFKEGRVWWSPIVLEIFVAHVVIYIQMFIEYKSWGEKRKKWYSDKKFSEQYGSKDNDDSETALREKLNQMF